RAERREAPAHNVHQPSVASALMARDSSEIGRKYLMRLLRLLCCPAAFIAFVALPARADEWNKLTYLTFSGPVQVPGTTLPAGTYMFKLADTMTNRHVLQAYDNDGD